MFFFSACLISIAALKLNDGKISNDALSIKSTFFYFHNQSINIEKAITSAWVVFLLFFFFFLHKMHVIHQNKYLLVYFCHPSLSWPWLGLNHNLFLPPSLGPIQFFPAWPKARLNLHLHARIYLYSFFCHLSPDCRSAITSNQNRAEEDGFMRCVHSSTFQWELLNQELLAAVAEQLLPERLGFNVMPEGTSVKTWQKAPIVHVAQQVFFYLFIFYPWDYR